MRMSKEILELWDSIVANSINKFGDESNKIIDKNQTNIQLRK